MSDKNENEESTNKRFYKDFFTWIVGLLFIASAVFLFMWVYNGGLPPGARQIYKDHFAAVVGLPSVAFFCTFLILLLKITEKAPMEFKMAGVEFKGTSGQVVLWVFLYLTVILSLKLLW